MTKLPAPVPPANAAPIMVVVGALVVVGVAAYYAFIAVDTWQLEAHQATATVVGKGYRAAGRTYTTQHIGGRTHTLPQATPEIFTLELDIGGQVAQATVGQGDYDALHVGDRVETSYQRRRITGGLQVLAVEPNSHRR